MRLTAILVMTAFLQLFAAGDAHAQKQTVSLSYKDAPLDVVMTEIRRQTEINFLYDVEWLKQANPVTIDMKDASLDAVLDSCFANQPFTYAKSGTIVTIVSRAIYKTPMAPEKKLIDVSGKVTNQEGKPLEGATVTIKETKQGVITDEAGRFLLEGLEKAPVLDVSYVNYIPQTIKVGKNNKVDVKMDVNQMSLDVVVKNGYTSIARRYTPGTIERITADDISKQPITNVMAALQGRVTGMLVTQQSGLPGSVFSDQIRGQKSVGTRPNAALPTNSALFVIDGVPFLSSSQKVTQTSQLQANNPISTINPNDIESIEILKDANATSMYGSLGANGVILITTRRPKFGKTTVDVTMSTGWSKITRAMDFMNTEQYAQMRLEAIANDGARLSDTTAPDLFRWGTSRNTDWVKELIGGTAHISNAYIRLSGGSEFTQFTASAGYIKESTVFPGDFGRSLISLSMQLYHTSENKKLEFIMANSFGHDKSNLMMQDLTAMINSLPNSPKPYDESGKLVFEENGLPFTNPFARMLEPYNVTMDRLTSSVRLNYKLFPWLQIKTNLAYGSIVGNEYSATPIAAQHPSANVTGNANFGQARSRNWLVEPQLDFNHSIGEKGRIKAVVGTSFREQSDSLYLHRADGYKYDSDLNSLEKAGSVVSKNQSSLYRIQSAMGLINYSFDRRYIVELTGRRDGSSRFGPNKQFGNFGSFAGVWIFSNEKFIEKKLPFLSYGKLRISHGSTGNDQILDYEFMDGWANTTNPFPGNPPAYTATKLYNNDFRWETHRSTDISLDLGFLKDRILLTLVWNKTRTYDQLIQYILPSQTGFNRIIKNSPGVVGNRNIEMELSTVNVSKKDFKWTTSANITIARNTLINFPGLSTSSYSGILIEGKPINLQWGYRTTGVNPETGVYEILDRNGNVINFANRKPSDSDKVNLDSYDPRFYGGLSNSIQYKNWKFDFLFQFVSQTGYTPLAALASTAGFAVNVPVAALDRWRTKDDETRFQQYTQSVTSAAYRVSDYYARSNAQLTDASFIRLKTLSLSYSLPYAWIRKLTLNSCSLFVQGQNLLTITSYSGHDPESGTINSRGLPPLKTFAIGIQASL